MGLYRILLLLVFTSFTSEVFASYSNVKTCIHCSYTQKKWHANNYAMKSSPLGVTDVHVMDLSNFSFQSFSVTKGINPLYPMNNTQEYTIAITDKQTPADLIDLSNSLIAQSHNLEFGDGDPQIPISVLPNPWAYIGCDHCALDIENYIRDIGTVARTTAYIEEVFKVLGIFTTSLPNEYEIQLEAGGRARFELRLGADGKLLLKITSIIDSNNNIVPAYDIGLNKLRIRVGNTLPPEVLNQYLVPLGYFIPLNIRSGSVIIKDCPESSVAGQPC